jgi:hypothetical protein
MAIDRDLAALSAADRNIVTRLTEEFSDEERAALFLDSQRRWVVETVAGRGSVLGPLEPGHVMAKKWTFTAKRWEPISFLFRVVALEGCGEVIVSSVYATHEGRGYFRDLITGIERTGLRVVVPSPLAHMTDILVHYGFEFTEEHGVDVWRRP